MIHLGGGRRARHVRQAHIEFLKKANKQSLDKRSPSSTVYSLSSSE